MKLDTISERLEALDAFAVAAMTAYAANGSRGMESIARDAYALAEAMVEERGKLHARLMAAAPPAPEHPPAHHPRGHK